MNPDSFLRILSQHLARFQATAQQLAEARQLDQPTEAAQATLLHDLTGYAWAVRSRALLLRPNYLPDGQREIADKTELHLRLSVIETLLATRFGRPPASPIEPTDQEPPTHALLQRLATAESRLFHLFGVIPLN